MNILVKYIRSSPNDDRLVITLIRALSIILILACTQFCSTWAEDNQVRARFILPQSYRAEGKITLSYTRHGEQSIEHHLAFSEITDSFMQRSKVSIGYVSYEQNEYYNRANTIIKVNNQGRCEGYTKEPLIPELYWFAKLTYTDDELNRYFASGKFESGPSVLLRMPISSLTNSSKVSSIEHTFFLICLESCNSCQNSIIINFLSGLI